MQYAGKDNTLLKWIRHNQGVFVAVIIVVGLMVWTFGCHSEVKSPISGNMVTRHELELEVDIAVSQFETELVNLQAQAALQFTALDRQDEMKRKLFEFAALTAQTGTFNPIGLITLAGTILGMGLGIDNRIKDKVIKNRPLNDKVTT